MTTTTTHARRAAAALGAVALTAGLALAASPAHAATAVATSPTTGLASSDSVGITITFDTATEVRYSVAQCDANALPVGTDCKRAGAISTRVPASGTASHTVAVEQYFANASFVPGSPSSSPDTSCASVGPDDCVIAVQTYDAAYNPVSTTLIPLEF